jgi:hypothetical protein
VRILVDFSGHRRSGKCLNMPHRAFSKAAFGIVALDVRPQSDTFHGVLFNPRNVG